MKLQVKTRYGETFEVEAQATTKVEDIKKCLSDQMREDINYLRLVRVHNKKGHYLQDDLSIGSYNISDVSLLVVINARGCG